MNRYVKVGNKYKVEIYGTKYDRFFWIDEEDYEKVKTHTWYYQPKDLKLRRNDYGAVKGTVKGKRVSIHRFIMGESPDETRNQIDHIDNDVCNNCKSNLRWVNNSENNLNKRIHNQKRKEK